jgi:hypothetical protein
VVERIFVFNFESYILIDNEIRDLRKFVGRGRDREYISLLKEFIS